jgi:Protein of unknown function (DUF2786)
MTSTADLQQLLARAAARGWSDDDLDRVVARKQGPAGTEALAALRAGRPIAPDAPVVELRLLLLGLPELPRLPGSGHSQPDADLLRKVRALLAKAESTDFDAEAEALSAKAQELMARHRIDRAVLAASDGQDADEVAGRRIWIDDPYADAKFTLLAGVAEANGARAVWSKHFGFSEVFGFAAELDVIEELFTSLLVQANAALRREGPKVDAWGRSRTRRFRRSFLVAYAHRIGERLQEAVSQTVEEVTEKAGTDLVPILAARDEAVDAVLEATFPELGKVSMSVSDAEGVFAGRLHADQADLSAGPTLEPRPA